MHAFWQGKKVCIFKIVRRKEWRTCSQYTCILICKVGLSSSAFETRHGKETYTLEETAQNCRHIIERICSVRIELSVHSAKLSLSTLRAIVPTIILTIVPKPQITSYLAHQSNVHMTSPPQFTMIILAYNIGYCTTQDPFDLEQKS